VAVVAALFGGIAIAASGPAPRQVVSPPASPADFIGITPVRVLDTRGAAGGPIGVPAAGKLGPNSSLDVAIGGEFTIPAEATAVAVNVTLDDDATLKSFLTVYPTGVARPNASTNNAEPGLVMSNSAIFQLGTGGKLTVYNQQGTVNVIIDVTGYFVAESGTGTTTTTAPGGTTTTTAPAVPALTTDAATYPDDATSVAFTGTGWTGCGDTVNVSLGGGIPVGVSIDADGNFTGTFPIGPLGVGDYVLVAEANPAVPGCTADAPFAIVATP